MKDETVRGRIARAELNTILQNVLHVLEADDEKSFEEKKEIVIDMLQRVEDETILAKTLLNMAASEKEAHQIQAKFWNAGEVIQTADNISLRRITEADREHFLEVHQEYAAVKSMLKNTEYRNMVWKEHSNGNALMFSILRENKYAGYCGIENLSKKPWEISIELHPDMVHQGIGYIALRAMLDAIQKRLGVFECRIKIDPTNYPSQRLFEKLGAVPNGISSLLVQNSQTLEQLEQEGMHLIDEKLVSVAEKFVVKPQELLSHVLEYKLLWQ